MEISIIISVSSLFLCILFFIYCKSYIKRKIKAETIVTEYREELQKLLTEIEQKTDRDALLIEDRIKIHNGILEDVDKRISLNIREVDKRRVHEEAYIELGRSQNPMDLPSSVAVQKPPKAHEQESAQIQEPAPTENKSPRIVISPQQIVPKPPPIAEQVAELAKAGLSSRLIARRLGVSISEVELAIGISEPHTPNTEDRAF